MDRESFEGESWDKDANDGCDAIFEHDQSKYESARSQGMDQEYMGGQGDAECAGAAGIRVQSVSALYRRYEADANTFQRSSSRIEGVKE
jgi:hypothetical protein